MMIYAVTLIAGLFDLTIIKLYAALAAVSAEKGRNECF